MYVYYRKIERYEALRQPVYQNKARLAFRPNDMCMCEMKYQQPWARHDSMRTTTPAKTLPLLTNDASEVCGNASST